jgi:hypothetical protein
VKNRFPKELTVAHRAGNVLGFVFRFVSGHDFSRAATGIKQRWALAPGFCIWNFVADFAVAGAKALTILAREWHD